MTFVDVTKKLLLSVPASTEAEALTSLAGVTGRGTGQFGAKLADWLSYNKDFFLSRSMLKKSIIRGKLYLKS